MNERAATGRPFVLEAGKLPHDIVKRMKNGGAAWCRIDLKKND